MMNMHGDDEDVLAHLEDSAEQDGQGTVVQDRRVILRQHAFTCIEELFRSPSESQCNEWKSNLLESCQLAPESDVAQFITAIAAELVQFRVYVLNQEHALSECSLAKILETADRLGMRDTLDVMMPISIPRLQAQVKNRILNIARDFRGE